MNLSQLFCFITLSIIVYSKKGESSSSSEYDLIDYIYNIFFDSSSDEKSKEKSNKITDFDLAGQHRRKFAMEYFLSKKEQNMACSPISALLPLGKLVLGVEGGGEGELLQDIGTGTKSQVNKKFRKMIKNLKNIRGVRLRIASKIYVSDKVKLNKKFKRKTKEIFKSSFGRVDFQNKITTSQIINEWVTQVSGKALSLNLDYNATGEESALIVNVVTFAGNWEKNFTKVSTEDFHSPRGIVSVPMMNRYDYFNNAYSYHLKAQIVEIPFKKRDTSFVLFFPDSKTGLTDLLTLIRNSPDTLNDAIKSMTKRRVSLTIPRFKIESREDIIPIYKSCGVHQVFTPVSGLNNIIRNQFTDQSLPLTISSVTHITEIDVYEQGADAASDTAMKMVMVSGDPGQLVLHVNHPFLFYIKSKRQQLLAGTFAGY